MKIFLVKKLLIGFILVILCLIILVSVIFNYIIGNKFKDYLVDEQKIKIDNVIKVIDELYSV